MVLLLCIGTQRTRENSFFCDISDLGSGRVCGLGNCARCEGNFSSNSRKKGGNSGSLHGTWVPVRSTYILVPYSGLDSTKYGIVLIDHMNRVDRKAILTETFIQLPDACVLQVALLRRYKRNNLRFYQPPLSSIDKSLTNRLQKITSIFIQPVDCKSGLFGSSGRSTSGM